MSLFEQTIDNHFRGAIFQWSDAFEQIVRAIFWRFNLDFTKIENLTPSRNAVFRVDNKVIKIFAPIESGFYCNNFEIEIDAQK